MGKSKSGGSHATNNLLRTSGILFLIIGAFHTLRYFLHFEFRVAGFELTYLGSLVVGILLLWLAISCFIQSR
jgi:uncharacterized protein YjeT (DUF2065 family)